jgi:hypothetical protein
MIMLLSMVAVLTWVPSLNVVETLLLSTAVENWSSDGGASYLSLVHRVYL